VTADLPTGAGGYDVQPPLLDRHATALDDVAQALATAADAARTVTFDSDAYGVFCRAIPLMLQPLQQQISDAVTSRAEQVGATAGGVRDTASTYRDVDDAAAADFRQLGAPLEPGG